MLPLTGKAIRGIFASPAFFPDSFVSEPRAETTLARARTKPFAAAKMDMLEYRLRRAVDIENHHQLPEMAVLATNEFGAVEIGSSLVALVLAFLESHAVGKATIRMVCKTFERVAGPPTTECLTFRFTNLPPSTEVELWSFTHLKRHSSSPANFVSVKSKISISSTYVFTTHCLSFFSRNDATTSRSTTLGEVFDRVLKLYEDAGKGHAAGVQFFVSAAARAKMEEEARAFRKEQWERRRALHEKEELDFRLMVANKTKEISKVVRGAPNKRLASWAEKEIAKQIKATSKDVLANWSARTRVASATRRTIIIDDDSD